MTSAVRRRFRRNFISELVGHGYLERGKRCALLPAGARGGFVSTWPSLSFDGGGSRRERHGRDACPELRPDGRPCAARRRRGKDRGRLRPAGCIWRRASGSRDQPSSKRCARLDSCGSRGRTRTDWSKWCARLDSSWESGAHTGGAGGRRCVKAPRKWASPYQYSCFRALEGRNLKQLTSVNLTMTACGGGCASVRGFVLAGTRCCAVFVSSG